MIKIILIMMTLKIIWMIYLMIIIIKLPDKTPQQIFIILWIFDKTLERQTPQKSRILWYPWDYDENNVWGDEMW